MLDGFKNIIKIEANNGVKRRKRLVVDVTEKMGVGLELSDGALGVRARELTNLEKLNKNYLYNVHLF